MSEKSELKSKLVAKISYVGAVNEMNKLLPNLAKFCYLFTPLSKYENEWNWALYRLIALIHRNDKMKGEIEVKKFKCSAQIFVICDTGKDRLAHLCNETMNRRIGHHFT